MLKSILISCVLISCLSVSMQAQSEWMEWSEQISSDEEMADWTLKYEELQELAEHPLNLNAATREQLEQFPFLSDQLIENILYYLYKYGSMLTINELWGVEGMDWRTRHYLQKFVYVGEVTEEKKINWRKIWTRNKQEVITRAGISLNQKAGYADYDQETLDKYPNRKYLGNSFYHNIRYRFSYANRLFLSFSAEKDAGEPFFRGVNRKGYDSYAVSFLLQNMGRLKTCVLGNYRANFGYGLVLNTGAGMGIGTSVSAFGRMGNGLTKYTSVAETGYLRGTGFTWQWNKRWNASCFYSFRKLDASVDNHEIRSFKTDGMHRLPKDLEKKNTVSNHLVGSNLSYNGKYLEVGLTAVYNCFNKLLNPVEKLYNRFEPRGRNFLNLGVFYKLYFNSKWMLAGETAIDKQGSVATLNSIRYSPSVNTTWLLINRYYDKRYHSLMSNTWGENSKVSNEAGICIGLETKFLQQINLSAYGDFFCFPWYRYLVDRRKTMGVAGNVQLSYSPIHSLDMLIKYSIKNKAKNHTLADESKYVLPYIRQRLHARIAYAPCTFLTTKTTAEYVHTCYGGKEGKNGFAIGETVKFSSEKFPLQGNISGVWFRTDNYDSRIYLYEPGLLYTFPMNSLEGKGYRMAVNLRYDGGKRWMLQVKWGCTHYTDRRRISSGTEEIAGNNKADLQLQLRVKW